MTKFSLKIKIKAVEMYLSGTSSTSRTTKEEYQIIQELRHEFEFGFSLTEILPYTTIKLSTFYYQAHRRVA